jgi:hypothetical protein
MNGQVLLADWRSMLGAMKHALSAQTSHIVEASVTAQYNLPGRYGNRLASL